MGGCPGHPAMFTSTPTPHFVKGKNISRPRQRTLGVKSPQQRSPALLIRIVQICDLYFSLLLAKEVSCYFILLYVFYFCYNLQRSRGHSWTRVRMQWAQTRFRFPLSSAHSVRVLGRCPAACPRGGATSHSRERGVGFPAHPANGRLLSLWWVTLRAVSTTHFVSLSGHKRSPGQISYMRCPVDKKKWCSRLAHLTYLKCLYLSF